MAYDRSNMPTIWGEGTIFAFFGLDGPTNASSQFVMTLSAKPFNLLIHTPQRRIITCHLTDKIAYCENAPA
jgi:hypothetical protein